MKNPSTRRSFLKSAAAGIVLPAGAISIANAYPANTKVRHAACGVTGMGGYDLRMLSGSPHSEIVALCDIDDGHLGSVAKKHPKAARYNDFRKTFD